MWNIQKVVKKGEYLYALVKGHPRATSNGYVLLHRVVVENSLGRLLNANEVVHHKNGDKKDNSLENLEVLTAGEHTRKHGYTQGVLMVELKCPNCKGIFFRTKRESFLQKPPSKWTACSRSCRGSFARKTVLQGQTCDVEQAISENLIREFRKFPDDNPEETDTTGSVETIRLPPENGEDIVQPTTSNPRGHM
jgi:phage FluMu protein Com